MEISTIISLRGESSFWLILRKGDLQEDTIVIKLSKEERSQRIFISFGTWVIEEDLLETFKTKAFKIFTRQQLVDFSKVKSKMYIEKDICDVKLQIIDSNEEKVSVKAFVNENKVPNEIACDYFFPFVGLYTIMFAGVGDQCTVKSIIAKAYGKIVIEGKDNQTENRNCQCCSVF